MKKLFIDMDGVIAKWQEAASIEELVSPGYFKNLIPQENIINALKKVTDRTDIEVAILSMASISKYAAPEKNDWLNRYAPFIKNRILITNNESKGKFANDESYLIDDYTINLNEFESCGGTGIKFFNTVNSTKGTWEGFALSHKQNPESIYKCLCAFLGLE